MTNPYYNPTGVPATRAQLSSSAMRTELTAIEAGFNKLAPTLTANALLHVNAAGTQQTAHAGITVSAAGAVAGITDLTATGNAVLGNASTDTLNVGNGGIIKNASGNVGLGAAPTYKLDLGWSTTTIGWYLSAAYSAGISLNSATRTLTIATKSGDATDAIIFATGTAGTERARIDTDGNSIAKPPASPPTLSNNGDMVMNLTSDTNLRISARGSDGVTRVANITLA